MDLTLSPELAAALYAAARRQGVPPDELALHVLRERFLDVTPMLQAQDEWENGLLSAARECGVSLSNSALSSDGLYD